jgi:hypothetical protein
MFHPATLLLAWAEFALVLPLLPLAVLATLLPPVGAAAFFFASARTRTLLRRARWLLLSLALLFSFATPGLSLPGLPGRLGMTEDGLLLGAEHLARLLLLLATLALLHERLGTAGFVTGLHWILGGVCRTRELRERIVVRLMLVVEFVDSGKGRGGWRDWLGGADAGPHRLTLTVRQPQLRDWLALALLTAVAGAAVWPG